MSSRAVARIILVASATLAVLYFLYLIRQVVGAVFIAAFLAIALGPAVDFFHRRKVPRALSILIVYLGMLLAIVCIGLLVVPPVAEEIDEFASDVPGYVDDLRQSETIREYDDRYDITGRLRDQAEELPSRLASAGAALQSVTVGVFSAIFQLVTILVMTFFLLLDGKRITEFFFRQMSPAREKRARAVAADIYKAVGGYVTGAFTISLIAGFSTYLMLKILGIDFAVPLAVLMGFLVLIPLVGATIGGVIIAVVAALTDFPTALLVWTAFFIAYQQIENNVLQPFIYRRTLALHPLAVIIAILIGASLLGVLGALLAIPMAATVQILLKDWWHFRKHPTALITPEHAGDLPEPPPPDGPAVEAPVAETPSETPEGGRVLRPGEQPTS